MSSLPCCIIVDRVSPNIVQGQGVSGGVLFSLAEATDHMALRVALLA